MQPPKQQRAPALDPHHGHSKPALMPQQKG
jgi:hypothetical protein